MTCPYVTALLASAVDHLGRSDHLVVPTGCDAMRRAGDALAARLPGQVSSVHIPRTTDPVARDALAHDLEALFLRLNALGNSGSSGQVPEGSATFIHPTPRPKGGAFIVAGPLSDDGLVRLVESLGLPVSGVESCTGPDRAAALAAFNHRPPAGDGPPESSGPPAVAVSQDPSAAALAPLPGARIDLPAAAYRAAKIILEDTSCPRTAVASRRAHLHRRLDETAARAVLYARLPFCDPGAYDALTVALLAKERGLPFLEVEVTYPFEPAGPLRVRIEAFLETLLLDPDLLDPDLGDPDLGDPEGDPDDPNPDGDFFDDNGRGAAARKHVRSAEAETGPWRT